MSVFPMAHYLTIGHPTEKDYIQPFTVMAEEHPPSPMHGDEAPCVWEIAGQARNDGVRRDCCL